MTDRPKPTATIPLEFPVVSVYPLRLWAMKKGLDVDGLKITIEVATLKQKFEWEQAILLDMTPTSELAGVLDPRKPPPFSTPDYVKFNHVDIRLVSAEKGQQVTFQRLPNHLKVTRS